MSWYVVVRCVMVCYGMVKYDMVWNVWYTHDLKWASRGVIRTIVCMCVCGTAWYGMNDVVWCGVI